MTRPLAFALCLFTVAATAPQQDRFDLVCKGHSYMTSWEAVDYGEITTKLRLDISAAKFCSDDCNEIKDIARIDPDRIVLYDTSDKGVFSQQFFDTGTAKLVTRNGIEGPPPKGWEVSNESDCEVTKFSGFPTPSPDAKR